MLAAILTIVFRLEGWTKAVRTDWSEECQGQTTGHPVWLSQKSNPLDDNQHSTYNPNVILKINIVAIMHVHYESDTNIMKGSTTLFYHLQSSCARVNRFFVQKSSCRNAGKTDEQTPAIVYYKGTHLLNYNHLFRSQRLQQ